MRRAVSISPASATTSKPSSASSSSRSPARTTAWSSAITRRIGSTAATIAACRAAQASRARPGTRRAGGRGRGASPGTAPGGGRRSCRAATRARSAETSEAAVRVVAQVPRSRRRSAAGRAAPGAYGCGSTGAPAAAAITAAATSACWAASPPCLMPCAATSPTAWTPSRPSTRVYSSTGTKPSGSHGTPRGRGPDEPRQRDRAVDRGRVLAQPQRARRRTRPRAVAVRTRDPAVGEQLGDHRAGLVAEDGERRPLSRHEGQPGGGRETAHGGRGLQRELVDRQRPRGAGGDDERHAADRALAQRVDDRADALRVLRAAEGERAADGLGQARAERQHERVVAEPRTALRLDDTILEPDASPARRGGSGRRGLRRSRRAGSAGPGRR